MLTRTVAETNGRRRRSEDEVEELFGRLTGRWTLQILVSLSCQEQRFSTIRKSIPKISANVLTVRLRELEATGLVRRELGKAPCSFPTYQLGPLALHLRPALECLARWKSDIAVVDPADVVQNQKRSYLCSHNSLTPSSCSTAGQ
ncbi:helix-turn-helix transcriptional regulator (plasmid) [Sphingomonas morindae]|uniref:Helix-turn-helix transcriptional regulator n=2 Tax=Sphingomonas morindae TaxID=1541170 RepID=A0ABY4XE58_9SPHN|nr:helix-turn-helix transcriptional regulator [Sphingomonas morindae]